MAMEPMDVVKQTGKTIIFEEFDRDENKMNLVTLLTRDDEDISLEKFKEALMGKESELVVDSFEKFVEMFSPTIYETIVKTGETSKFVYELDKPKYECTQIKLKDHAFYKMIISLLERKASSDKGNMEFPYDELKKALSPESEMEECKKIRRNLLSNTREYMKLTESGEPSAEAERFAQNIMACRDKIVEKYQNKSPLALLPLLIADKQSLIEKMKTAEEPTTDRSDLKAIPCSYSFDDKGNLCLIEQSISDDAPTEIIQENGILQLVEVVKEDFQDAAPLAIKDNTYVEDLVVNVFVPSGGTQLSTQDRKELELAKKQLQDIYSNSLESFAKAVSAVVEKFAGIKSFFDHATCDGKLAKNVSVIVSNCKIDAILNDELAKRRFKKYFGALSTEKDINKIWFGIIPAIAYGNSDVAETKKSSDPWGRRSNNKEGTKNNAAGLITLSTAKEMLSLLNDVKIMTFINYKAGEKTGFAELTDTLVGEYKRDFESVNSEYAVFAYPNFTILPKEKNSVRIGTEYRAEEDREVGSFIVVPGIYLEASYVACGMMVGIQNYRLLQSKGYKIKPEYPCVRFDIEDAENSKKITTKLNRETTMEMAKAVKDEIMRDRFGFVFADNKIIVGDKILNNSYVLNARTLCKEKGRYKSIYKTLVKNMSNQILRSLSDNITNDIASGFIRDYVEIWKRDNKDEDRKYANRILREGDDIKVDTSKHRFEATFNRESEIWDDTEIHDSESEE